MKVFNSNLLKFLQFQFPASATFFGQPSFPPSQPSMSAAAEPSTHTSAKVGATEEVHFSLSAHSPPHLPQQFRAAPTPTTFAIAERPTPDSPAKRKGKATAGRTFDRDIPSSPEDEADQRPAKRRRRYHIITADGDEEDSSAEIPVSKPMQIYARNDQPCRIRKQQICQGRVPAQISCPGQTREILERDYVFISIFFLTSLFYEHVRKKAGV
ncbi:hypothetical protein GQ457_11G025420 [Hibiscus cannabinus]